MNKVQKQQQDNKMKTILSPKTIIIGILLIVGTFFFIKNIGDDKGYESADTNTFVQNNSDPTATQNVQTKSPALELQLVNGKGEKVNLSDLKGKVIFINFWATWCPPCISEMPSINHLYLTYKNDPNIVFLMVDMDNNYENAHAFMKKNGYALPVYTPSGEIPQAFFAGSLPTTVIVAKSGEIVANQIGAADFNDPGVSDFLNRLLQ